MSTAEQITDFPQQQPQKNDRLIGWLVSYGLDEKGLSHEIRAGRSIISSQKSNSNHDMSIRDKAISAPHLAFKASSDHRVFIQDIFSDNGSYITRFGEYEEAPIDGTLEVGHGDWIRLGNNTRFQVCLIDDSGS